jgi:hypothetical protein
MPLGRVSDVPPACLQTGETKKRALSPSWRCSSSQTRFHVGADLREGLVLSAVLYLCAGALRGRGRPEAASLKGLVVGSAAFLLLIILGWDSIHHAVLAVLLTTMNVFAACVRLRHLLERGPPHEPPGCSWYQRRLSPSRIWWRFLTS